MIRDGGVVVFRSRVLKLEELDAITEDEIQERREKEPAI
jgi:hypothetical protein